MRGVVRKAGLGNDILACCWPRWEGDKKRMRKLGWLHFSPDGLTPDLVAHELDHLVTDFLRRYPLKGKGDRNEHRASMVGRVHQQFWDHVD